MFATITINNNGKNYQCFIESVNGRAMLFNNFANWRELDAPNYTGSKRGKYGAIDLCAEIDVTNTDDVRDALAEYGWQLVSVDGYCDKPARVRNRNGNGDGGNNDKDAMPGDDGNDNNGGDNIPAPADADADIDVTEIVRGKLQPFGELGTALAAGIAAETNTYIKNKFHAYKAATDAGTKEFKEIHYITPRGMHAEKSDAVNHEMLDVAAMSVECGLGVYLYGPAGTGKSYMARQIAKRLNLDYYEDSKIDASHEIKGFVNAAGEYVRTQFHDAYKYGGLYFLDEIDASHGSALTTINDALANSGYAFPGIGWVERHPNFRCIAAGNTIGTGPARDKYGIEYVGRHALDAATLDRFPVKIETDYCERIEMHIATNYADAATAKELISFAHDLRRATAATNIQCLFSYRAITQIAMRMAAGLSIDAVFKSSFLHLGADALNMLSGQLAGKDRFTAAFKRLTA